MAVRAEEEEEEEGEGVGEDDSEKEGEEEEEGKKGSEKEDEGGDGWEEEASVGHASCEGVEAVGSKEAGPVAPTSLPPPAPSPSVQKETSRTCPSKNWWALREMGTWPARVEPPKTACGCSTCGEISRNETIRELEEKEREDEKRGKRE